MDLNLLRVFAAIYESRNLTAAANSLYVSQPAVSQSLTRLRKTLGDDLFFRSGGEMVPTPFANELYPIVHTSLKAIGNAVSARGFEPAQSRRRFRIALSEMGELHWIAPIEQAVRSQGRNIGVDVHALDLTTIAAQLSCGAIDLAIHSAHLGKSFDTYTIKSESYVVLLSADHPLASKEEISVEAYCTAGHVFVEGDSGAPSIEKALARLDRSITPRLRVNHFSALPRVLQGATLIATVPRSMAEVWSRAPEFTYRALPFFVEPIRVRLYARNAYSDAPALHWFRDTVLEAIAEAQSQRVTFPVPFMVDQAAATA